MIYNIYTKRLLTIFDIDNEINDKEILKHYSIFKELVDNLEEKKIKSHTLSYNENKTFIIKNISDDYHMFYVNKDFYNKYKRKLSKIELIIDKTFLYYFMGHYYNVEGKVVWKLCDNKYMTKIKSFLKL